MPTQVDIPQCLHIRASGIRCGSPALRGKSHCFYHAVHYKAATTVAPLPFPEDASSLQLALHQVIQGLSSGRWTGRQAALLLYALQIAASNLKRLDQETAQAAQLLRAMSPEQRAEYPYSASETAVAPQPPAATQAVHPEVIAQPPASAKKPVAVAASSKPNGHAQTKAQWHGHGGDSSRSQAG